MKFLKIALIAGLFASTFVTTADAGPLRRLVGRIVCARQAGHRLFGRGCGCCGAGCNR